MIRAEILKASMGMRQALRISNEESEELEGTLSFGQLLEDKPPAVAAMKRFLATPTSQGARALMAGMRDVGILGERIEKVLGELREVEKSEVAPVPLITGDDLTAVGMKPGPVFKRILDGVYDAQLEGRIASKDEAMKLALTLG